MKKDSFLIFLISLGMVGIFVLLYSTHIKNENTLICYREEEKIVFLFNKNGIHKMIQNGKTVSTKEKNLYNLSMSASFAWNKMNGTNAEIIKKHMIDVADFEKKTYNADCNLKSR